MKSRLIFTSVFFCFLTILVNAKAPGVKVAGNKLVNDETGAPLKLVGVSRSGTEFECVQGYGIFNGPSDLKSVQAIKSWNTNIVRVPLNEDCWLAINGVKQQYAGSNYINAISNFVNLLNENDFVVILELHWSNSSTSLALGQSPMPDMDHSPDFWRGVASVFGNNTSVMFGAFNEPYPDNNSWDSTEAW